MHDVKTPDLSRIAQDLQIRKVQVESVVQLLDEGNTVPFIARYRRERTSGLKEEVVRQIQTRVNQMRQLADRKQTVLRSIEGQGKLTDELRSAILAAETSKRLDDLYLPFKAKKRSAAAVARERGLEPLAQAISARDPAVANLAEVWPSMVNPEKELPTVDEVRQGVQLLLAEQIAETADVRAAVRSVLWETGKLTTARSESATGDKGQEYKDYFQFTEPVRHIPPHRILAINRGEKENVLKVKLEADAEAVRRAVADKLPLHDHPHAELLKQCAEDALVRLLLPGLEREIRRELTEEAEDHAIRVFARNLRSLLLQPPLRGQRVLAIDPGFRNGCRLVALDEAGAVLDHATIHPHQPQNRKEEAKHRLEELIRKHQVSVIAIGNGTACRETEELVADLIARFEKRRTGELEVAPAAPAAEQAPAAAEQAPAAPPVIEAVAAPPPPETATLPVEAPAGGETAVFVVAGPTFPEPTVLAGEVAAPGPEAVVSAPPPPAGPAPLPDLSALPPARPELAYVVVNEAGASHYSGSAVGREEFPNYDAALRGTISIGRRLQDPLTELVKIEPQNVGVGLYQHDLNPKRLKDSLDAVIESCVNYVGVDLNAAGVPLLRHVSGLNSLVAREIVDHRKQHGPFRSREQLQQLPSVGAQRYVQAAGFVRVVDGDDPLDETWIHPESYPIARRLLTELGFAPEVIRDPQGREALRARLNAAPLEEMSTRLELSPPALGDLFDALANAGRDPRDELPPPIFRKNILRLEDLQPGMELKGTVLNVVDFGAFVDIGLKDSGLVHISQMANRYVKNPYDVVAVGDVVTVWVLTVDHNRRRVSLTMIQPGTERKPSERKPQPQARPPRGGARPPRGRRPVSAQVAVPGGPGQPAAAAQESAQAVAASAGPREQKLPAPVLRPRKPQRQPPRPKLSKAALEGDAPLRTFSELKAFFDAKREPEPPPAT